MSVVVVAVLTPKPGEIQKVLDGFAKHSPLVHNLPGCELYAAHSDGSSVIMVERWATRDDLKAHAEGPVLQQLMDQIGPALARPYDVYFLENHAFGDPDKGTIPVRSLLDGFQERDS
jgi:quinol monooxygenase YgiN